MKFIQRYYFVDIMPKYHSYFVCIFPNLPPAGLAGLTKYRVHSETGKQGKKLWSGKSQGKRKTNKKSGKNIFYYIFNIVLGI